MKIESTKDLKGKKINICVYGKTGTGKTHLISTIPEKALILNADKGVLTLRKSDIDYATCVSWKDVSDFMKYMASKECAEKYKWIIFDSFSAIAEILQYHLKNEKNMKGFELWGEYSDKLGEMIRLIRDQEQYSTLSIFESSQSKNADGITTHAFNIPGDKISEKVPFYFSNVFSTHCKVKDDKPTYFLQTIPKNGWEGKARGVDVLPVEEAHLGKLIKKLLIE